MTSHPTVLVVLGGLVLGSIGAGCGKRPTAQQTKSEVHDRGAACLRVTGGVFQGPGKRTVEATVVAPGRGPCTDHDIATCTVEQGEHGEIVIKSSVARFPPYGECATDAGPMTATCLTIVTAGDHDIVFGRKRERHLVFGEAPICLED